MGIIQSLQWRYATKKFDNTKKVSAEDLEILKEAVRLSASSYGLQPYKVLIIENAELRAKLQPAAFGQSQIVDASHLLVFCRNLEYTPEMVEAYTALKSDKQGIPLEKLAGMTDYYKARMAEKSPEQMSHWTARQTYIALGNLLAACGELKIDACPMEGFKPNEFDEILGLKEQGLASTVLATIGYRSAEDKTQHLPKFRKPSKELFEVR